MKAYIKVKKDRNSGLIVGHSLEMQKAMNGFNELAWKLNLTIHLMIFMIRLKEKISW